MGFGDYHRLSAATTQAGLRNFTDSFAMAGLVRSARNTCVSLSSCLEDERMVKLALAESHQVERGWHGVRNIACKAN